MQATGLWRNLLDQIGNVLQSIRDKHPQGYQDGNCEIVIHQDSLELSFPSRSSQPTVKFFVKDPSTPWQGENIAHVSVSITFPDNVIRLWELSDNRIAFNETQDQRIMAVSWRLLKRDTLKGWLETFKVLRPGHINIDLLYEEGQIWPTRAIVSGDIPSEEAPHINRQRHQETATIAGFQIEWFITWETRLQRFIKDSELLGLVEFLTNLDTYL